MFDRSKAFEASDRSIAASMFTMVGEKLRSSGEEGSGFESWREVIHLRIHPLNTPLNSH
jgi:hypothetical protein